MISQDTKINVPGMGIATFVTWEATLINKIEDIRKAAALGHWDRVNKMLTHDATLHVVETLAQVQEEYGGKNNETSKRRFLGRGRNSTRRAR